MKTSEKPLWYSSNASSYINIVLLVSSIVKIFYVFYSKFQNSESTNFMEILNERLDLKGMGRQFNVTTIMNSWTRQPSYPIVRCTRIANGRIRLSQMPHPGLLDGNQAQLWWIPLAMTDGKQPDFSPDGMFPRVWLTPGILTMEIPFFPPSKDENTCSSGLKYANFPTQSFTQLVQRPFVLVVLASHVFAKINAQQR